MHNPGCPTAIVIKQNYFLHTSLIGVYSPWSDPISVPVEDFAQLSGKDRETKYDASMEQVVALIERFCTFPALEKMKLFNLTLFNYLVGNEDMHLKNFSVIRHDFKTELSPAYDLSNSTIVLNSQEELALPLNSKKNKLKKDDFLIYFAKERLELNSKIIAQTVSRILNAFPKWIDLIQKCFLSDSTKTKYIDLLNKRFSKLKLEGWRYIPLSL